MMGYPQPQVSPNLRNYFPNIDGNYELIDDRFKLYGEEQMIQERANPELGNECDRGMHLFG